MQYPKQPKDGLREQKPPAEVTFNQVTQPAEDGGSSSLISFSPSSERKVNPTVNETVIIELNPNPGHDNVIFYLTHGSTELTLTIRDISGRVISTQSYYSGNGTYQFSLNISLFTAGIYFIEAETGDRHYSRKLVKQ